MRRAAFPAGRPPPLQSVPILLLCGGHVLNRRLRRLRAGHLAVATLHGRHDLRRSHRPAHAGKLFRPASSL